MLPLVMGAFSVPLIVERLGVERFGVLTLIWAIFGYFSLFDFGIGRALTKRVAETRFAAIAAARAVRAGLLLLLALGVLSGLVLGSSYPWLVGVGVIADTPENLGSLLWLAVGMPLLLLGIGLRGILEGLNRFGTPALARIVLGVSTFGLPIPLLAWRPSLELLVAGLVAGRAAAVAIQGWACRATLHSAWQACGIGSEARQLLGFGGWMMVSNLVSPLMVYADRFVIAASHVSSQLAYYTTPFELVTRLLVVPGAATTVLFPMMAGQKDGDPDRSALWLMRRGMAVMLIALLPVVIVGSLFARDLLAWWLTPDFAAYSTVPMVLLCWGILLNSLGQFPFAYLQSRGWVRPIALLHLVELPVYFLTLPWFLQRWGITGAAIAWVVRVGVDLVALSGLVRVHRRLTRVDGSSDV